MDLWEQVGLSRKRLMRREAMSNIKSTREVLEEDPSDYMVHNLNEVLTGPMTLSN